jgi:hypothetical protein
VPRAQFYSIHTRANHDLITHTDVISSL